MGWWVAGGVLTSLIMVLGWTAWENSRAAASTPAPVPVAANAQPLTPRGAADQLFNQVMTASEAGDQATVTQYLPLAIRAYEAARPLDMDGLFHMALLNHAGGEYEASLASAEEMLAEDPNHILGLNAAAQACAALGRTDEAAEYYRQVLDHVDTEMARPLPEYQTHQRFFGVARNDAQAFLAGG